VLELRSEPSADGGQIYTFVTFDVAQQLKGSLPPGPLVMRMLGGHVGDSAMLIPEGPDIAAGARMLLFIGPNPQALFPIVGLGQGAFTLTFDAALGEDRASNGQGIDLPKSALVQRIADALS
jgi:hypothetical protein